MRRLLLALLLAPGPGLRAQDEGVALRLEEAVARAQAHSARLLQLEALQHAAQAGLRGARAARLPQLELQAGYTRSSDVPELTVSIPGVFSQTVFPNIPDQYRTRAGLTLPVYSGGRIEGGIQAAQAQSTAAERDLSSARNDLTLETRTAYWTLVAARENERVLTEAVAAFEAHSRDAQNRERLGLAARNEVLLVQVERDRAELNRLRAGNAAAVANANLLRLVGLPPSSRIDPIEPRTPPEQGDVEIEPLVAQALESRPDAAALRSRIVAADAGVRIARSASLPSAGVSAGYDLARPNPRVLPLVPEWKSSWSVGLSVSWSAFDGGRSSAATAQAEAQAQALRRQLDDLTRRVRLEVTSRAFDLRTARAALGVAQRNLEAARESLRVSRDRYREGLIASSDLLDGETALLRAGLDETEAVIQLRLAVAQLERAVSR